MAKSKAKTTQDFIPIKEIRDGVVTLKNGQIAVVLLASSVNFSLKSHDEQIALLLQYQNLLNSLDFSIQIFIQSRKLDIRPYVILLEERLKEQTNELLKIQTREYIQFIKTFTEQTDIMTKSFFVVIPYTGSVISSGGYSKLGKFLPFIESKDKQKKKDEAFGEKRTQLEQRASVVAQGLSSIGVRVAQLGTEELIELYFKIFNPGEIDLPSVASNVIK